MNNRILLKDIPTGKFHSAILTTYSINLYYFEQQVLPLLGSKGIHYTSVLADSNMLDGQLEAHSFLSEQRKRNYAIHGIHCQGAFHPKIIFLAGETSLLVLLGSGNLTSSGHGKNLEVWNAIYVDNSSDEKFGFVSQIWNYIKNLHNDLGISAHNKLKSIEENCGLFEAIGNINLLESYRINDSSKISFLAPQINISLYNQLSSIIGDDKIKRITIMSPYYDTGGKLINLLNKRFQPSSINVILQEDFGAIPFRMKPETNIHFYNWEDVKIGDIKQEYFHAKNIVFEGVTQNYLLSGSANASIAAFGSDVVSLINQEACILYQSKKIDYLNLLGINLQSKKSNLSEFQNILSLDEHQSVRVEKQIFIRTIEKSYDSINLYLSIEKACSATICLFNSKQKIQFTKELNVEAGEINFQLTIPNGLSLMFGELFIKENSISNKQYIIDVTAFENTNPSPKNRSLNQIRKIIETGNFSTQKIIEFLNTIHKQKVVKKISVATDSKDDNERNNELPLEEESDLLYLSYEDIQKKTKNLIETKNAKGYIEYKSVRLWESIFTYLKERKQKEDQEIIDEEETEDLNKSAGRLEIDKQTNKKPISKSNHQRIKDKIDKFLNNYWDILESKIDDKDVEQPNLIDLSMFLIVLEILLHLSSHKEKIEETGTEEYLLNTPFNNKNTSWSEYTIRFIGMFSLWCHQSKGFKEIDNEEYKIKLNLYKKMAFKTTVGAISLFTSLNKRYDQSKIITWSNLGLLNVNLIFNSDAVSYSNVEVFEEFIPKEAREEVGETNFTEEVSASLNFLSKTVIKQFNFITNDFYYHPTDGFTIINKVAGNERKQFLKLFSTGYGWDNELLEYWNGKLYSPQENKWFSSRKDN